MPDLVIKNALLFLNDTIQPAEIAVDDGKISKIGKRSWIDKMLTRSLMLKALSSFQVSSKCKCIFAIPE